jgi:cytochrome c-type biogenesis protein CcmH/NrfF
MVKNILAPLFVGGALLLVHGADLTAEQRARIHKLENSLLAPCCHSEVVARHNSEVAVKMQIEIAAWGNARKSVESSDSLVIHSTMPFSV